MLELQKIGEAMKFFQAFAANPNLAIDAIGDGLIELVRAKLATKPVPSQWTQICVQQGFTPEQAAQLWIAAWKVALNA